MQNLRENGEYLNVHNYTNNLQIRKYLGNRFPGYDFGGKITTFYQKGEKTIFKIAGHNGWYELGATKYYPPYFLIGTLIGDTFTQYHEIEYTRKYAKQAKEKALELVASINTKEK